MGNDSPARKQLEMISSLYTVFSCKVMRQIYAGFFKLAEEKYTSAKRAIEHRFNCRSLPMQNINDNIGLIIITFIKTIVRNIERIILNGRESDIL